VDGPIAVTVANDTVFARLTAVLDQEAWLDDPRFASETPRSANRDELDASLEQRFNTMTRSEVISAATILHPPARRQIWARTSTGWSAG
jgi:crotonobetainyl-CoA:carnitine CoA-transferase CaiB-like acyl-CoA transferase